MAHSGIFADSPALISILPGVIDEASGIADSKSVPGSLWVEQDSNNPNNLYLLGQNGVHGKVVNLKGLVNRDWEDLVLSKGPDAAKEYLYLADIGDNLLQYDQYYIHRFPEPAAGTDTVFNSEKIAFSYPDGSHNAEAIVIDPATRDIYIFTKAQSSSKLFKLAYPQSTSAINTATLVGELALPQVVSAALSPDAKELIIKTYTSLQYFTLQPGESIATAIKRPAISLKYQWELQGEAICFKNDNSGFFTLSERPTVMSSVGLNFYKRK